MDTDIGYPMDDFIGSDSVRSLAFGYNGYPLDPGGNGQNGYGANPPAFGAKMLNEKAGSVMFFSNGGGITGNPSNAAGFDNLMQGKWLDGSYLMNGGTPDKFAYSGNPFTETGWTEEGSGNTPGDRRLLLSSSGKTVTPGQELCFDFAFVFNQDANDHLENVNELYTTADFVQNYYDMNIQPCNQVFLGNQKNLPASALTIYPNPSGGTFTIQSDEQVILSVFDLGGKALQTNVQVDPSGQVNLDLNTGIYIFELRTESGVTYKRIEILK